MHVVQGRVALVNCSFNSEGKVNNITSTGILLSPNSRVDLLGPSFRNNDIGIESVGAEVFVQSKKGKYKGIEVNESVFQDNTIGIYGLGTFMRIENTSFTNHVASLVGIESIIDISKKSENIFSNNENSIIISGELLGKRGLSQFLNNKNDLIILNSEHSEVNYDLSCNLWLHNGINDKKPLYKIINMDDGHTSTSNIFINSNPYVEVNGKERLQCKGNNKTEEENITTDELIQNQSLLTSNEVRKSLLSNNISLGSLNENYSLVTGFAEYGAYRSRNFKYKEHLFKNILAGAAFNYQNVKTSNSYKLLVNDFLQRSHFITPSIGVTNDRLAFLSSITHPETDFPEIQEAETVQLSTYPNPSNGIFTLDIEVNKEGFYSIELLPYDGRFNTNIASEEFLVKGHNRKAINISNYPPGLYILSVREKGKSRTAIRVVKN